MQERVDDFMRLGVAAIRVLNPWERIGYAASKQGFQQPEDGVLRIPNTPIATVPADVFAELDQE